MKVRGWFLIKSAKVIEEDMTKLILKNASIVAQSGGEGVYEITLSCRTKDVVGSVLEVENLEVEIKSKETGHRD